MRSPQKSERKNDTIMMAKIDTIITSLGNQNTEIAVIRTKAEATEEHLKTLNSKVALQEGRQQATDSALALNSQAIGILLKERETTKNFWERNWEKFFWTLVIPGIIYFVLNK